MAKGTLGEDNPAWQNEPVEITLVRLFIESTVNTTDPTLYDIDASTCSSADIMRMRYLRVLMSMECCVIGCWMVHNKGANAV